MTKPDYLVPRHRKQAVHWIRPAKMKTAMFGEIDASGIACGMALKAQDWVSRAAKEKHRVTCAECWKLAQDAPDP